MSRIFPKSLSDYPWYMRLFFHLQTKKYGGLLDPLLLWGRIPKVFMGFLWMQKAFNRKLSPLSPLLRAQVMIRISQLNECSFCVDMNAFLALQKGDSEKKISLLETFRESTLFSPEEKAALEYAEAMTHASGKVSDALFQELREYFSEDAIVELTALIAFQNLSSKFNSALRADAFGFCQVNFLRSEEEGS